MDQGRACRVEGVVRRRVRGGRHVLVGQQRPRARDGGPRRSLPRAGAGCSPLHARLVERGATGQPAPGTDAGTGPHLGVAVAVPPGGGALGVESSASHRAAGAHLPRLVSLRGIGGPGPDGAPSGALLAEGVALSDVALGGLGHGGLRAAAGDGSGGRAGGGPGLRPLPHAGLHHGGGHLHGGGVGGPSLGVLGLRAPAGDSLAAGGPGAGLPVGPPPGLGGAGWAPVLPAGDGPSGPLRRRTGGGCLGARGGREGRRCRV